MKMTIFFWRTWYCVMRFDYLPPMSNDHSMPSDHHPDQRTPFGGASSSYFLFTVLQTLSVGCCRSPDLSKTHLHQYPPPWVLLPSNPAPLFCWSCRKFLCNTPKILGETVQEWKERLFEVFLGFGVVRFPPPRRQCFVVPPAQA